MNKQHIQLPNNMTKETKLTPQDLLVYVSIKRYMNKDTKEAFPSLQTIANHCGASIPTIRKCIKNLKDAEYITITKKGRLNIYKFSDYKKFEPFSYEFLDKEDLTFTEKAYQIAAQQYQFKENGIGKISITNKELAEKINMSEATISRCNKSLESKGYLDIIKAKQAGTGITINEKFFHLNELGQAIIFTLQNHENRISQNTNRIEELEKQILNLQKDLNLVLKENQHLKGLQSEFILE